MKFELPALPYNLDALEPVISRSTMEFHYGKHEQTYINNLNKLIEGTPFENKTLDEIVLKSDGAVFNNAAQAWNHIFYFNTFIAPAQSHYKGTVAKKIDEKWGSFEAFKDAFVNAGTSIFGSGWVWLTTNKQHELEIIKEPNAGNPITKGLTPLLTFDVWEHAYYLDYQNRRADQLNDLFKIVNWQAVDQRYL